MRCLWSIIILSLAALIIQSTITVNEGGTFQLPATLSDSANVTSQLSVPVSFRDDTATSKIMWRGGGAQIVGAGAACLYRQSIRLARASVYCLLFTGLEMSPQCVLTSTNWYIMSFYLASKPMQQQACLELHLHLILPPAWGILYRIYERCMIPPPPPPTVYHLPSTLGADFIQLTSNVTFSSSAQTEYIMFSIISDKIVERQEMFFITVGPATIIVTINDEESKYFVLNSLHLLHVTLSPLTHPLAYSTTCPIQPHIIADLY